MGNARYHYSIVLLKEEPMPSGRIARSYRRISGFHYSSCPSAAVGSLERIHQKNYNTIWDIKLRLGNESGEIVLQTDGDGISIEKQIINTPDQSIITNYKEWESSNAPFFDVYKFLTRSFDSQKFTPTLVPDQSLFSFL